MSEFAYVRVQEFRLNQQCGSSDVTRWETNLYKGVFRTSYSNVILPSRYYNSEIFNIAAAIVSGL